MTRDRFEELIAGIGTLLFGIIVIAIGIAGNDKLWFMVAMIIVGTMFAIYGGQYLARTKARAKKRH